MERTARVSIAVPVQVAGAGSRGDDNSSSAPREFGHDRRKCERRRQCLSMAPACLDLDPICSLIDKLIFD